jgi:hypothetical protein
LTAACRGGKLDPTRKGRITQGYLRRSIALAIGVGALAIPASAGAATQIGETFAQGGCSPNFTWLQGVSPQGRYAAPFAGVLTSWSFQTNASAPQLKFKVGRPAGGNSFTIIGESGVQSTAPNALNTFPVQIPVEAGDVIGFYTVVGTAPCVRAGVGYNYFFASGDLPPGATAAFGSETNQQLNIAATLEPDCDSDGLGDETQDPSLLGGDCPLRGRTLTLDANKNKVKKGKRVTLTGRVTEIVRQGECQSAQTVELQRKRPKQTAFTTVEQLQTDAAGNFSAKKKVKKTFQYRAQVLESATCAGQTSNAERVKVKGKKN